MGIKSLEINFCGGSRGADAFRPGESVCGTVNLEIGGSGTHKISTLYLKIRGKAKTSWSETDSDHYSETVDLIREDRVLLERLRGRSQHLEPGSHEYDFVFNLPDSLPPSLKFFKGRVVYKCKAHAISSSTFSSNVKKEKLFTVVPKFDLNLRPSLATSWMLERKESTTLFTSDPGNFRLSIPHQGYVGGEIIDIRLDGPDRAFKTLAKRDEKVEFKRRATFWAGKRSTEEKDILMTLKPGKSPSAWTHLFIRAPHEEVTVDENMCSIINVTYYIKIMDVHIPVTMGTVKMKR